MGAHKKLKKSGPRFKVGDNIILDQAEYEVLLVGEVHWDNMVHKDSYGLWDKDGYGRIESIKYVDENATE